MFVCLWVCGWVCYHDKSKLEIACIDPHKTGFVGKGSDHLQLIKFWPSRALGKGVCGGAKIFGSALLQPARSVFASPLSAFFIISCSAYKSVTEKEILPAPHLSRSAYAESVSPPGD